MTLQEKFNYMKNFTTYGLDGEVFFALPMKYPNKKYSKLYLYDIYTTNGFFVLGIYSSFVEAIHQYPNYNDYKTYMLKNTFYDFDTINKSITDCYDTLIEFENKVKQLNGG